MENRLLDKPSVATGELAAAWDRMALTIGARPADYGAVSDGVRCATGVMDAALAARLSGAAGHIAPSAGAIHPYECCVVASEEDGPALFRADLARRVLHRLRPAAPIGASLRSGGVPEPPGGGALLLVLDRPWLSMRKYGARGHLYTHLDTAHLAVNLLGSARVLGLDAHLRVRFRHAPLTDLLGAYGRYREVHSVLCIGPGANTGSGWETGDCRADGRAPTGDAAWLEETCWSSITPLPAAEPGTAPAPGRIVTLRPGLPLTDPFPSGASWRTLTSNRRSAKDFRSEPLPAAALWRLLSALGASLVTDLPATTPVRLTLVTRSVPDTAPTIRLTVAGPRPDGAAPSAADVLAACQYQPHLGRAAAFVLCHARRDEFLRHPWSPREALFRAGAVGHLVYLGAAEAGVGVTGIGGFCGERWRRIAALPGDHEVLYVIALGPTGSGDVKWDRLQPAYAQGER
jgi:nitroreductase